MPGLWLATMLLPVTTLLPACHPQPATRGPDAPIWNLRVEPDRGTLTWDLLGNVSGISCFDGSRNKTARDNKYCHYEVLPFCSVTNYTVRVAQPPFSAWILFPEPGGDAEAAARDLRCEVHDRGPLGCRWAVGMRAPRDLQYQLTWKNVMTEEKGTCPHYDRDAQGRNVGCRFNDIHAVSPLSLVVVSGTSDTVRVPCTELSMELEAIETFSPPNITSKCNETLASMSWAPPRSHFRNTFEYELQTQQIPGGSPVTVRNINANRFQLPNPGTYSARIRAKNKLDSWTAWSAPQTFECGSPESRHDGLRRPWVLLTLGALALLLLLGLFVCRRYSLMRKIFPPLPPMKDPLGDTPDGQLMSWEAAQEDREDCPVTEVQVVERE